MKKKLSQKQMKIAGAAEPKDKITGEDFAALRNKTTGMSAGGMVERIIPKGQKPFQVKLQKTSIS